MQLSKTCDIADPREPSANAMLVALLATGAGVAALAQPGGGMQPGHAPKQQTAPGPPIVAEFRVSPAVTLTPPLPVLPQAVAPAIAAPHAQAGQRVESQAAGRAAAELARGYDRARLSDSRPLPVMAEPAESAGAPLVATAAASPLEAPLIVAAKTPPASAEPPAAASAAPAERVEDWDLAAYTRPATTPPEAEAAPPAVAAAPQRMMPAAELKAMMIAEVASRSGTPSVEHVLAVAAPQAAPDPYSRYSRSERGIEFDVAAQVNGSPAGKVPLLIADGENISVRLGDLLAAIQPAMDEATFAALSPSPGADEYVTFNMLRAHGIAVRFDAQDRLVLGEP